MLADFQEMHSIRPGEICFEIDNEQVIVRNDMVVDPADPMNPMKMKTNRREILAGNCHEHFSPVPERKGKNFVRSRIVPAREEGFYFAEANKPLRGIPFIPGERIHVDMTRKTCRITDAIFDKENESLCVKLMDAAKNMKFPFGLFPADYFEADYSKNEEALWTWIFWMRKIADGDQDHGSGPKQHKGCATDGPRRCRPIQNIEQLPTLEECAATLKVKLSMMWMGSKENIKQFEEDLKSQGGEHYRPTRNGAVTLTPEMVGAE